MKRMRGASLPSPGQKPTPRADAVGPAGAPPRPRPPPPAGGVCAPAPADACASVGGAAGAGAATGCSVCAQISLPVSPSSATTRVPLDTYITPFTTSGTDVAPPPRRIVHASFSDETLLALICFSGE